MGLAGDVFAALRASGALREMRARGVRLLEVHSLEDNLLARPADPVFLGACLLASPVCPSTFPRASPAPVQRASPASLLRSLQVPPLPAQLQNQLVQPAYVSL